MKRGLHKNTNKYDVDGKMVTYFEQTKIELNRFIEKGFASYFLIMQDLIKHSHDCNWQTGPARGCSIPGSLVNAPEGKRNIEDINIDDFVYDIFGDLRRVTCKMKYDINELIFKINDRINITSDHKLYIVRNSKVILVKASEIKNTDRLIISQGLLDEKTK
jgi:hypothetical protein